MHGTPPPQRWTPPPPPDYSHVAHASAEDIDRYQHRSPEEVARRAVEHAQRTEPIREGIEGAAEMLEDRDKRSQELDEATDRLVREQRTPVIDRRRDEPDRSRNRQR